MEELIVIITSVKPLALAKASIDCFKCPFHILKDNVFRTCNVLEEKNPVRAIEIVGKWAKEHSKKTNLEKLEEVFPNDGIRASYFYALWNEKQGIYLDCKWLEKEYKNELLDQS